MLTQFITYITFRIAFNPKNMAWLIIDMAEQGKPDTEIYKFMKENLAKNASGEEADFSGKINKTIRALAAAGRIKSILDIGTEDVAFLDALEYAFDAKVNGININAGFEHYSEKYEDNIKDKRFQIYDGRKIPFGDRSMDLVTIYSVLHHIPAESLSDFITEVKRVTCRYVFIKENDLRDESTVNYYDLQHEIFEGAIVKGNPSFRSEIITYEQIHSLFLKNGFQLVENWPTNNFRKTYYALFEVAK